MKKIFVALSLMAMSLLAVLPAQADASKDHLVVTVSNNDTRQFGMMIAMAGAALKTGRKATIVLGGDGFRMATIEGPQHKFLGKKKTPRELLKGFMEKGGKVIACALCVKLFGIKQEDLLPGVKIGKGGDVMKLMFESKDKIRVMGF